MDSKTNIPLFSLVRYRELYPGIDLVFLGSSGALKSEFLLSPGADPTLIRLRYAGARVSVDSEGGLSIRSGGGELNEPKPVATQGREEVPVSFAIAPDGDVHFVLGAYDHSLPLVIDPTLNYSAVFNGNNGTAAMAIAADGIGDVYVAGWTDSSTLPTVGPEQATLGGGNDAFVMKINTQGNAITYATFLGGIGDDRAFGIAVDPAGEAVVVGWTQSPNFPTLSAAQSALSGGTGQDGFVTKLNAAGNGLIFSTFVGGAKSDTANAVALNAQGLIWVAGDTQSTNFPMLGAFQGANGGRQDAFAARFSASGQLQFSTYLGGNGDDHGAAIAVDPSGNALIAGSTYSTNFPVLGPYQARTGGGQDAFLTKLNPAGALIYGTYLGGSGGSPSLPEGATGVASDPQGNMYVAGTTSSQDFPTLLPLQGPHPYGTDIFLTKLNPQGSALTYSTYLGGSSFDFATSLLVDGSGCAYLGGQTSSQDFPVVNPYQASPAGLFDGFWVKVNTAGTAMVYSSYVGGSQNDSVNALAADHQGNLYLAGQTLSLNFPEAGGIVPLTVGGVAAFVVNLNGPGDHTPFLNRLYRGFFNRPADPGGLAYYNQLLDSGTSEPQIGVNFYNSPECQQTDFLILEAYIGMQGAEPPYASFASNLTNFASGTTALPGCLSGPPPNNTVPLCSQLALIGQLIGLPPFQTTYGSLTNVQFVPAFLQALLGVTPSPSTVTTWTNALNGATSTRAQFVQYWLTSAQYAAVVTTRIQADMTYYDLLLRTPEVNGRLYWTNLLNQGMPLIQLVPGFMNSAEFKAGI
jgi:hypothetical protein